MNSRTPSRILIGLLALWHTFKTFGKRKPPVSPTRILIANHLLLGDTLMLTPLLAKLRAQYPDAEIVMTVPKAIVPLYRHRPYDVDAALYDPRDLQSLAALRKRRGFDLALVPADNRYSWLARALNARWIVAFAGDRPAYKSWPVDAQVPVPAAPCAWGDMVAGMLPGAEPDPYQPADWRDPELGPFQPPAARYCVLHVGAGNPLRLWPADRWEKLADRLAGRGLTVVWSGGKGEEGVVRACDPQGRYHSYAGKLDLVELWWLIKRARLLVCPDTGIAHLGRIVNTPTVVLFGPGSSVLFGAGRFWRASPFRAVTIPDFPCRDQRLLFKREVPWMRHCARRMPQCGDNRCMQAVSLDVVTSAAEELLLRQAAAS